MARPRKPARIYKVPATGEWFILDGDYKERVPRTDGGGEEAAEARLAQYIINKSATVPVAPQPRSVVSVLQILTHYAQTLDEKTAAPERIADAIDALIHFWSSKSCEQINEDQCQKYADWRMGGGLRRAHIRAGLKETRARERVSRSTVRRELNVLRAAVNKSKGRLLHDPPTVWMPSETEPRPDWLTRDEFAAVLWELWKGPRPKRKDGTLGPRQDRTKHAARIALCQFYTGSRPGTIGRSTWHKRTDGPWIDLIGRIWYRRGDNEPVTVKTRKPHGIPNRLHCHLERWRRLYGWKYVVEHPRHPRKPIRDIGKALETAVAAADIQRRITPHTLKHTAITLAIQSGMSAEDASDFFSTSLETIQRTYWHHSPHHQARAVAAMDHVGRGRSV